MTRTSTRRHVLRRGLAAGVAVTAVGAVLVAPLAGSAEIPPAEVGSVIAHRGDRQAAPENTVAAIRSAIFKGADAVEVDVRWTRTGVPVVLHDETLDRTTDCSGAVAQWSLAELAACDAGSWFAPAFRAERVPTLEAALDEVAVWSDSVVAVVHLKTFTAGWQPRRIMQTIRDRDMEARTVFIADDPTILNQIAAAGAERLGLIFSWPFGWDFHYPYMIPQDMAFDPERVAAAHRRGATVWAIEGRPAGLTGLPILAAIDGVLVNDLDAIPASPSGQAWAEARPALAAPGWSAASGAASSPNTSSTPADSSAAGHEAEAEARAPAGAAPPGAERGAAPDAELAGEAGRVPADMPMPSSTFLSFPATATATAAVEPEPEPEPEREPAPAAAARPFYVEPANIRRAEDYGPKPVREGGWRPSARLRGPAAGPGS